MFMAFTAIMSNAQIAIEETRLFDNVSVGAEVGVTTPLSLNSVFPMNTVVGLHATKWFAPAWGAEVEGDVYLGSHMHGDYRFDGVDHNFVRRTYLGVNHLTSITNLIYGYYETPRVFEMSMVLGVGWLHTFTPNHSDRYNNDLAAKTGLDLAFNLGRRNAHALSVRPAIIWNLSTPGGRKSSMAFNRYGADLYLGLGYTYYFKTSNKTHRFKTHDVGMYLATIADYEEQLSTKPKQVVVDKIVVKEVPVVKTKVVNTPHKLVVYFEKGSSVLSDEAKAVLDTVVGKVTIEGFASPEGTRRFNERLAQRRADAVADYIASREGVLVVSALGRGVSGVTSNRVVEITVE